MERFSYVTVRAVDVENINSARDIGVNIRKKSTDSDNYSDNIKKLIEDKFKQQEEKLGSLNFTDALNILGSMGYAMVGFVPDDYTFIFMKSEGSS